MYSFCTRRLNKAAHLHHSPLFYCDGTSACLLFACVLFSYTALKKQRRSNRVLRFFIATAHLLVFFLLVYYFCTRRLNKAAHLHHSPLFYCDGTSACLLFACVLFSYTALKKQRRSNRVLRFFIATAHLLVFFLLVYYFCTRRLNKAAHLHHSPLFYCDGTSACFLFARVLFLYMTLKKQRRSNCVLRFFIRSNSDLSGLFTMF